MYLKSLEITGFKSFAKKSVLEFTSPITGIVGPNGSGKSNVAEAFRFVLGEQSIKSLRGKRGEDLIWGGSALMPRANRAGVKVLFDNSNRFLNLDFDEVSVERVVHRDGVNQYALNGSQVRLKDILELLFGAHIGSSGHHIISQGEADRILSAGSRERREMIEDALGLKLYQYKRAESTRKLEKTRENVLQVGALRKELAPHLSFLKRQVDKIERSLSLRDELLTLYREYLHREGEYLAREEAEVAQALQSPQRELDELEDRLKRARTILSEQEGADEKSRELLRLEETERQVRGERETLSRDLGRLEGQIASGEKRITGEKEKAGSTVVPLAELETVSTHAEARLMEALSASEIGAVRKIVEEVLAYIRTFVQEKGVEENRSLQKEEEELALLVKEKDGIIHKLTQTDATLAELSESYAHLKEQIGAQVNEGRKAECDVFDILTRQSEVRLLIQTLTGRGDKVKGEREAFKQELTEAAVLVGREVLTYTELRLEGNEEGREKQAERRRTIERMKLRLEEAGASGADEILKEYEEVKERDTFLEREISDLEASALKLEELIAELSAKLDSEFREGIHKINKQFGSFFALMFGGGTAALSVVGASKRKRKTDALLEEVSDEPEEREEGIEISISLPKKRVKGLEMLSGGERALTSIALIFAMSQVNPPPFLVLDETDAALDEANSRRYGDMIESLSKKSQLILITHNRETMSRAGVLYGVTMGGDGVSKLLSVKFEEAVAVAK